MWWPGSRRWVRVQQQAGGAAAARHWADGGHLRGVRSWWVHVCESGCAVRQDAEQRTHGGSGHSMRPWCPGRCEGRQVMVRTAQDIRAPSSSCLWVPTCFWKASGAPESCPGGQERRPGGSQRSTLLSGEVLGLSKSCAGVLYGPDGTPQVTSHLPTPSAGSRAWTTAHSPRGGREGQALPGPGRGGSRNHRAPPATSLETARGAAAFSVGHFPIHRGGGSPPGTWPCPARCTRGPAVSRPEGSGPA